MFSEKNLIISEPPISDSNYSSKNEKNLNGERKICLKRKKYKFLRDNQKLERVEGINEFLKRNEIHLENLNNNLSSDQ